MIFPSFSKMAGSPKVAEQPFHVRSISLPSTSQPNVLRVEEELQKIGAVSVASSTNTQMMCKGLNDLTNLYGLIEELLCLPSSKHSVQECRKKLVEEQLDFSLKLLDLIGAVKDIILAIREHIQVLQSAIRRKPNIVSDSRKKVKKMIKDCVKSLKQMDQRPCTTENDKNNQLVKVLKQAQEMTKSLLESVLLSQPKSKTNRWSIISKAMSKRKVVCEGSTEKESVQLWLSASYDCIQMKDTTDTVNKQLEELELRLESLESGLECLFRQLIQNRVSLLNIISL